MPIYGQLLKQGFRRSGKMVYRPHCETCAQCRSTRIAVDEFTLGKRYRRVLKNNKAVSISTCNARFQQEHFELYRKYTASRHKDGSMADSTEQEYKDFLITDWGETLFVEFREEGRLLGVAVTDQLDDGLSAVYTFFDPDMAKRSLGTFAVLMQIELAKQLQLPFLYLGYWVRDCGKMAYKTDFRPIQVFTKQKWHSFAPKQEINISELPEIPSKD